ncbi:hypothetical protein LINPERPRIM_LOCUS38150, partial [Linum perenne]
VGQNQAIQNQLYFEHSQVLPLQFESLLVFIAQMGSPSNIPLSVTATSTPTLASLSTQKSPIDVQVTICC